MRSFEAVQCQSRRIGMIIRQPIDVILQRIDARSRQHARLAQPAADHLPPASGLDYEILWTDQN